MGKNSIRENLSKNEIISEIKLVLSADIERDKCFVIVEGIDDLMFFNGKLKKDVCLQESFSGKDGVIEIINFINDERVIGICDADYDQKQTTNKLFYYDYCCLEMMMISNQEAFDSFCSTYYLGDSDSESLKNKILCELKFISLLRQENGQTKSGIDFKTINYSEAYIKENKTISEEIIIRQLNKNNKDLNAIILKIKEYKSKTSFGMDELLNITQGHDFLYFFKEIIENNHATPSYKELIRSLISSFHFHDFVSTKLYQDLCEYQRKTGLCYLRS